MITSKPFTITSHATGLIMTEPRSGSGLSTTCKSYVKKWLKSLPENYGRRKSTPNKYTDKGLINEDDAIEYVAPFLGWTEYEKKPPRKFNEFSSGECDVLRPFDVDDIKCSWDETTFPLFETVIPDKNYEWQIQNYMEQYNKPNGSVIYVLTNTPDHLIEQAAIRKMYELGFEELEDELYQHVREQMVFDHLPDYLRIKQFNFERDFDQAYQIKNRVHEIREWIHELPSIEHYGEIIE